MKSTYSIEINAPQDIVFEMVDNDEEIKKWIDGLVETSYPMGKNVDSPVGTKFIQKIKEGGKIKSYDGEVTLYDKPNLLGVKLIDKMFSVDVIYRFTQIPNGTRLNYEADVTFNNWIAKTMGKLFSGMTEKILVKQMNKLKQLAESKASMQ